jgi:hypothetical protein
VQSLGDGPGDRALVGDSENDSIATLQVRGHEYSLEWERITGGKKSQKAEVKMQKSESAVGTLGFSSAF